MKYLIIIKRFDSPEGEERGRETSRFISCIKLNLNIMLTRKYALIEKQNKMAVKKTRGHTVEQPYSSLTTRQELLPHGAL